MKYTRKEIFKKAYLIGLPLITPALITGLYNYTKNESDKHVIFEEANKDFMNTLEEYAKHYAEADLNLDMMIINDESIKDFDFVFLTYDREIHDAPHVAIPKNEDYHPNNTRRLNDDVKILKNFAERHNIFIYNDNDGDDNSVEKRMTFYKYLHSSYNDDFAMYGEYYRCHKKLFNNLIKKIRDCGEGNYITEDLYRNVSYLYTVKNHHENQIKRLA